MKTDKDIYKEWPFPTRFLDIASWNKINHYVQKYDITSILEFGSGLSTILLNNIGLDIISYETDSIYLREVKKFNLANVEFRLWNNVDADIKGHFGLSLVDGILPRMNQLYYAQKHSRYIAIDDFNNDHQSEGLLPMLKNCNRLDDQSARIAIFRKSND